MKELLLPLLETAVWGVVIVVLGRILIGKLDSGVNRTLDRLRRAGPAEFDPLPKPQSETKATLSPPSASIEPVSPTSLLGVFEASVRDSITSTPPHEREAVLTRLAANAQLAWVFETLNSTILGSQIALLLSINTRSLHTAQVREIYEQAASRFPEYYRTYPFDAWVSWFIDVAKFGVRSGDELQVTEAGREFAKYIVSRGASLVRFG